MTEERWISVRNWRRFQHYHDRRPVWIKDYPSQLDDDEFRDLTFAQRGLLQSIREAYAKSRCELRDDSVSLTRRLGKKVSRRMVDQLVHAGFLDIVASRMLADGYQDASLEVEVEKDKAFVENSDPREAKCPHCRTTFKGPNSLAEHLYVSHGGPEPEHWLQAEARVKLDA